MSFENATEGMFWVYSCGYFVVHLYIDDELYVDISTHDLVYVENDMYRSNQIGTLVAYTIHKTKVSFSNCTS